MKKTAVLLYPQFSEYELSVALSVLMQGGKPVVTVGINNQPITGESGLTCLPDTTIDEVNSDEIDSLLLTGCMDIGILQNEEKLFTFIREMERKVSLIASISSSPYLLAKAGVLKGKKYTVGLTEEAREALGVFEQEHYSNDRIVQDGKFITAIGSGFLPFGILVGKSLNLSFDERWYQG
jgi:protein deglycase